MWFLLATCVCDLMLSVLHYALYVSSLLDHITTPSAGSAPYAQWSTRATPCCWSNHKQQSIFAILTVFIAPMITNSMDLGSPSLSSQLLICSLLLHQINWFTREIDWKDWCTNLGWWGMNQTRSACSLNFLCNLISVPVPCSTWAEHTFSLCRADLFYLLCFFPKSYLFYSYGFSVVELFF